MANMFFILYIIKVDPLKLKILMCGHKFQVVQVKIFASHKKTWLDGQCHCFLRSYSKYTVMAFRKI